MEAVDDSGWRGRRAAVVDDDVVAVVDSCVAVVDGDVEKTRGKTKKHRGNVALLAVKIDVAAAAGSRRRRHHVFRKVGDGFPFLRRESPICGCVPKWWLTPKSTKTIAMQFIL